jgi:hypothetical protein
MASHSDHIEDLDDTLPQKRILLNAFDMSTVGHLSPGQWKVSFRPLNYHSPNPQSSGLENYFVTHPFRIQATNQLPRES